MLNGQRIFKDRGIGVDIEIPLSGNRTVEGGSACIAELDLTAVRISVNHSSVILVTIIKQTFSSHIDDAVRVSIAEAS